MSFRQQNQVMKKQNYFRIHIINIYYLISNIIKQNNDILFMNLLVQKVNSKIKMNNKKFKDNILKKAIIKNNNIIKKNFSIINYIENDLNNFSTDFILIAICFIFFMINCIMQILCYIKKLIYNKPIIKSKHLFYDDISILIFIFCIIIILIKRIFIKKVIGKEKREDKKSYKRNIIFFDIKKDFIKINMMNNIIVDINYILIFIFLMIINISNQINNRIDYKFSKMSLKVNGIGIFYIFYNESNYYKFKDINYLKEVYINGNKQDRIDYNYIFNQTKNIVELIWDNNLDNCAYMFYGCSQITEIDLSNFNTSKIKYIDHMFGFCSSLTFLNLSNFNTSNIKIMDSLFEHCSSLTSLDLSNFNTSQVTSMRLMFNGCRSLTSLDLSNFNTSLVTDMAYMFEYCSSLTSLDLSNFNTSQVTSMQKMFYSSDNLEYINLKNFNESKLMNYESMFFSILENIVICINEDLNKNKILPLIKEIKCYTIDCSKNWKSKQKKIISETNECIDSCDNSPQYKYEYNGKCYESCLNGLLYDDNNVKTNKCKCELDKCLLCPKVALNKRLCTKCNINYHIIDNDSKNLGEYINCYNQLEEGYYLDIINNVYKKCYHTCKTCNFEGNNKNHYCLECNENYLTSIKINNYLNCYENCYFYYYFDNENNFHCTKNFTCPKEYPKLMENNKECIEYNIEDIIQNILNYEKNNNDTSKEQEIEYYDIILKNIEKIFTLNYNTSALDNGIDKIIKSKKLMITLTTTQNQRNNINNNMTTIDLGKCETLMRYIYNISDNESLYMKKIDIIQEGMKTLKVEYDVYAKLSGTNLIKLNISACEQNKILIYIPIVLTEHIDKFNTSSGYYNDICYTATTEDGTDILLKDRQKEYYDKDYILCQEDCDFSEYNYESFRTKCSCKVKKSSKSIADMNINKTKILNNFKNIKNFINFNFLVCYKKLFNIENLLKNIGFFIILAIIVFHILTIFIFCINQFSSIINKIKNITLNLSENVLVKKKEKKEKINKPKINRFNSKIISIHKNKNDKNNRIINKKFSNESEIKLNLKINKNKQQKMINVNNYIDEEINRLSYNLSLKCDKRTYCQYYTSLIKTQHSLICAIFNKNDYNSQIIKIDLFLIEFIIEYTVNALFYNDNTMHKIYESKGDFDLETQILISFYSTIISMVLNSPLNFLALTNDAIINFKQSKRKFNFMKQFKHLKFILIIKFVIYFIISFLILLCFWYYITMFGVIYKNTQIHLLKDTLISFGLSLVIPFVIYLFPGIFRVLALSNANKRRKYLYNFSKFLQSL